MGLDLHLQEGGILGTADGGEGPAAAAAVAAVAGELMVLDHGGQVGMVATAWPRLAALLAARAPWRGGGRGRGWGGGGSGLRLAAEELLLAEAQLGAELLVLLLEQGLAL